MNILEGSTTWSNHVQLLCQHYNLPSPLSILLQEHACSKEAWNSLVKTMVTSWHERKLREMALSNSKMIYLNIQLHGLSGRPHPCCRTFITPKMSRNYGSTWNSLPVITWLMIDLLLTIQGKVQHAFCVATWTPLSMLSPLAEPQTLSGADCCQTY